MSNELTVWLIVSFVGVIGLPFFFRRRYNEWRYCQQSGGPLRWSLFKSRMSRTVLLSTGVLMAALVALVVVLPWPDDLTRTITIVLLIGVEACMVGTLWSDEFWAKRIDSAPDQTVEARMDAQDRRMDAEDMRMDDIELTARGHAGQEHHDDG